MAEEEDDAQVNTLTIFPLISKAEFDPRRIPPPEERYLP
jgi:hypothetical protein